MAVSSTTTQLANSPGFQNQSLQETLADYQLRLSGAAVELASQQTQLASSRNPANWPTEYRRIPPYRPINRSLDLTERPNGANRAELLFVTVMLNGVRLQSGLVRAWECTGGHWYPQLTRYKIGGEW